MTEKREIEKQKRFGIKRKKKDCQPAAKSGLRSCQPITFSVMELKAELMREAQTIRIPAGAAEEIAERVAEQVGKWVEKRPAVTVEDIHRRVALEIEKYSPDLAYVYQNRGKII